MIASMHEISDVEEQTYFGIKKILDCKIEVGGRQMYKVKWEPTWEPAENLVGCQHLVDEFWSFINKSKLNEEISLKHRKNMGMKTNVNVITVEEKFNRLSADYKTEIQDLIVRNNSISIERCSTVSPSNIFISRQSNEQQQQNGSNHTASNNPQTTLNHGMQMQRASQESSKLGSSQQKIPKRLQNINYKGQKRTAAIPIKIERDDSRTSRKITISSLKYLEHFENPYVKIIIVCKICNKEQSLKFAGNWRLHYMTHEQKSHKCLHCSKTFTHPYLMRNHMKSKHKVLPNMILPKQECGMMKTEMKEDNL